MADHPRRDARRSRAARRSRPRSAASPSQSRSAAPSATGSPGGTSSPGPRAVVAVPDRLGHPADVGDEHRHAARQGLGDDHAVGLGVRREHEQVRAGVRAVEVVAPCGVPGSRTRSSRPLSRARRCTPSANAGSRSRLTRRRRGARTGPSPSRARRAARRGPCRVSPPRRTAARRPPSVPGPSRGGVDAGLGDVHPVEREHVELRPGDRRVHPLVVTTAAADRRTSRSRERIASASSHGGRARAACARAPPAAARLAWPHEHRRGAARDEAVDQHDRAVGDPASARARAPCSAAPARGQAPRPRVRAPTSPAGEAAADPPVVGVAAARPPGVVDAVGHDDVDRASQRPLVARPRDVRLAQRHHQARQASARRPAPHGRARRAGRRRAGPASSVGRVRARRTRARRRGCGSSARPATSRSTSAARPMSTTMPSASSAARRKVASTT